MRQEQLKRMREDKGFIAALDQSGGSTPKALKQYGIAENAYSSDEEMFALVHEMRMRIIKSPAFSKEYILGAILFEDTMNRTIDGELTADFLWQKKGIVPFLKVDKGLEKADLGVQLMKPMPDLKALLKEASIRNIFGTKMRSVILEANEKGIAHIVDQQFETARIIHESGLVPILEPEVDIHAPDRKESEIILKENVQKHLSALPDDMNVMFKFSIPVEDNFYQDLMGLKQVVRIVALSGGYSMQEANTRLARNKGLIASFSRALAESLSAHQSDAEFNAALKKAIKEIYEASVA